MKRIRALDLFCCAGGASVGLDRAGFQVTGVDIRPQPHYPRRFPFSFIQADAFDVSLDGYDFIWASPPCQRYSALAGRNGNAHEHPDFIAPIRARLRMSGIPHVIENVEGAPLIDPVMLCGTMFPGLRVLRHRLFETSFHMLAPPHGKHPKVHTHDRRRAHFGKTDETIDFVQVTGGGNCTLEAAQDAMGIDWMNKAEINEAIPPAYAEYIGRALLAIMNPLQRAAE